MGSPRAPGTGSATTRRPTCAVSRVSVHPHRPRTVRTHHVALLVVSYTTVAFFVFIRISQLALKLFLVLTKNEVGVLAFLFFCVCVI